MRISDWSSDVCSSDLQRFGHARVDAVMAHLFADAVGSPAEREFGKIAGADHQPLMPVGEPEQVIGAQPRLHVLEGGVVQRLAAREGMVNVGEHLVGGGADVDLLGREVWASVGEGESVAVSVNFGGGRLCIKTTGIGNEWS